MSNKEYGDVKKGEYDFDDGLMGAFDDVDDNGTVDDTVKDEVAEATEQVDTSVEPTKEITEPTEVVDEDLSVDELNDALVEQNKGDLNTALHQTREKNKQYKYEMELKAQEVDLLRQQIEMLKSGVNTAVQPPQDTVEDTFLADLDDADVITKEQLKAVLDLQKQQIAEQNQVATQRTNGEKATQMGIEFNASHGVGLGDLSYQNIYQGVISGSIPLSNGQKLDIENAISDGKNPAKMLYNYAINNDQNLSKKYLELQIKGLISKKTTKQPSQEDEVVLDTKDKLDIGIRRVEHTTTDSHIDSLLDSIDF